jgi:hypothetical protein
MIKMDYKSMKKSELINLVESLTSKLEDANNSIADYSGFYSYSEMENAKLTEKLEKYEELNIDADKFYDWYCIIDDSIRANKKEDLEDVRDEFRKIFNKL